MPDHACTVYGGTCTTRPDRTPSDLTSQSTRVECAPDGRVGRPPPRPDAGRSSLRRSDRGLSFSPTSAEQYRIPSPRDSSAARTAGRTDDARRSGSCSRAYSAPDERMAVGATKILSCSSCAPARPITRRGWHNRRRGRTARSRGGCHSRSTCAHEASGSH